MSPSIEKTSVGEMSTLVLQNEKIRTVIVPGLGARILSLIYKPTETEFVWHSPDVALRKTREELENVSGFFDCVPTTDPCTFKNRELPLGGEVSSKPWRLLKIEKGRGRITVKVEAKCEIFPLMIRKQISLARNKSVLVLQHQLLNLSNETLQYHYSSHNTLQVSPYHRIVLPREVSKVKLGYTSRLGKIGDEIGWPVATDTKGDRKDISKILGPCEGTMENFYTSRLKEKWCAMINEARKEAIGVTWEGETLPYLLICTNNSGWRNYYFAALEPVSGRPDNLDIAVNQWKDYAILKPREKIEWTQRINTANNVGHVNKIENDEFV